MVALDGWSPPGRALLLGPNGAGKSSLLEALYLVATTRSFRSARQELCARLGSDGFSVRLEVGERPRRELHVGWSRASGRERHLDGKATSLAEHLAVFPLLVWTPADTELLAGAPEARRRFFDRALVHLHPTHLEELGRYERALMQKRALLARGRGGELDEWNRILARHASAIAPARAALVVAIEQRLAATTAGAGLALPPISLRYKPSPEESLAGEETLLAALERRRGAELARGAPLLGPQRDDIEILWAGRPARQVASAGERKAAGLLLLAALANHLGAASREPTLLVDDADTELDRGRVGQVAGAFEAFGRVLFTSNRPEAWAAVPWLERVDVAALARGAETRRN